MIMFIFGIIGLLFIIGVISLLADFENSVVTCLFGIIGIFCLYAIISGVMDFMFWLGYIIGPYSIIVTILLILSPFIVLYFYDKLKSNKNSTIPKKNNRIKKYNRDVALKNKFGSKTCPNCNKEIPANAIRCKYCKTMLKKY